MEGSSNRSIFILVGAKGGVGTSTLAVDVAKALAARGRTLLVDADLSARRSHAVLFNSVRRVDDAMAVRDLPSVEVAPNLATLELAANVHAGFMLKSDHVEKFMLEDCSDAAYAVVDAPQPFAAAIRPKTKGSSTTGVKKSVVAMRA